MSDISFLKAIELGQQLETGLNYEDFNSGVSDQIFGASRNSTSSTGSTSSTDDTSSYTAPWRKRPRNKGVLQYPEDLDTNIQDYFEIQVFQYKAAKKLPSLNQGTEHLGNLSSISNMRGKRQNMRLQNMIATIQLPMPNSLKDANSVGWGGGEMSSVAGTVLGPAAEGLLGGGEPWTSTDEQDFRSNLDNAIRRGDDGNFGFWKGVGGTLGGIGDALGGKPVRRRAQLGLIAKAAGIAGITFDVNQAMSRFGAVENPNLELLFTGPSLRSFSFTIRFTPRSKEESVIVRRIIRILKEHSAVKNPGRLGGHSNVGTENYVLGTPDVFKLRYIKAKTQKDIKGLNKFKTCALKSIAVDYTGEAGRFAAYDEDSQPITSIVTLNFGELVPIYDADYQEFTSQDDVGL